MTHICIDNLTIIGTDNGLSPGWRQAIIWTSTGILLIGTLGTNFIQGKAFEIVICEMAAILSGPQCVNAAWIQVIHLSDYIYKAIDKPPASSILVHILEM